MSLFSTKLFVDRIALYGSTTVLDTFGDGKMEKVASIRSGYSSRILPRRRAPSPEPVPPPRAADISGCGMTGAGTRTMEDLKSLEGVSILRLSTEDIHDRINQLGAYELMWTSSAWPEVQEESSAKAFHLRCSTPSPNYCLPRSLHG